MADLTSTSIIASNIADQVGLAPLMPGIDGSAMIGAFAGATLFVMSRTAMHLLQRLVYMAVSFWAGYVIAPEIILYTPLNESSVAAFFSSAVVVTFTLHGINLIQTIELPERIRKGKSHD